MSTSRRSPFSTFLHWVSTTPPVMVIRFALVSKIARSPVTTCCFCVTTTLPRASSRLIEELPVGPGWPTASARREPPCALLLGLRRLLPAPLWS
jgi:hypothetical protein